jgi:uncharacterized protein YdhG (YjbR/CyaY superfamily)
MEAHIIMEKTSRAVAAKDVDEYLRPLPTPVRAALESLRKTIRAAAPKAEEVISYQIPIYKYNGPLVCFAAFKNHCSFYVVKKDILSTFAKELEAYEKSGTTIHFKPESPLPASLVRKIVKVRIKQNEERITAKKKA